MRLQDFFYHKLITHTTDLEIFDLAQDCNFSIGNILEILQSCTEPLELVHYNGYRDHR